MPMRNPLSRLSVMARSGGEVARRGRRGREQPCMQIPTPPLPVRWWRLWSMMGC